MNVAELNEIITRVGNLPSEKESTFLDSAHTYLISKGFLTHGQQSWAESISNKYSAEAIAATEAWAKNWTQEHRKIALRVARYYEANPPYYNNYLQTIFSDPGEFILSKREWDKFCENKYAKKIRKEYDSPPKFSQGDRIQIRKTNKVSQANYDGSGTMVFTPPVDNKFGFIIKVNAKPITRAAKGSRIYQVLLVGKVSPIFCHESDLKNCRR
jgi:hypothetical protein